MLELGNYSLAAIFVTSIIVLLIASEVGHAFGWRAAGEVNVTTLEAAILGLLALMISFTFSMGLTRLDERRVAVLNELNNRMPNPYRLVRRHSAKSWPGLSPAMTFWNFQNWWWCSRHSATDKC